MWADTQQFPQKQGVTGAFCYVYRYATDCNRRCDTVMQRGVALVTVTGIAKALNVSPMTIYRRLKKNGVNVDELRDDVTGELTAAGASIIASMFPNASVTADENNVPQVATGDSQQTATDGDDDVTGNVSTVAAVLQARLDGANALIEQLTGERDELRRQLAAATAALEREQDDRRQERLLLTASAASGSTSSDDDDDTDDGQQRRGWLYRLFHG